MPGDYNNQDIETGTERAKEREENHSWQECPVHPDNQRQGSWIK